MADPQITKHRVTMRSVVLNPSTGKPETHEATDYVRPDFLDAYTEDARKRWQYVAVSEKPDAGPAGYYGETFVPEHLDHPLAGRLFPATTPEED